MKASELRSKNKTDLSAMLLDLRREQFTMRVQRSASQEIKVARIRELRREIARIKTVLNEPVK